MIAIRNLLWFAFVAPSLAGQVAVELVDELRAATSSAARREIADGLARLGAQATPAFDGLVRMLQGDDAGLREAATRVLVALAPAAIAPRIRGLLASVDPAVRGAAHLILLSIAREGLPVDLAEDLASGSAQARSLALNRIGGLGRRALPLLPAIVGLLDDPQVGFQTVQALQRLEVLRAEIAPLVLAQLRRSTDRNARERCMQLLQGAPGIAAADLVQEIRKTFAAGHVQGSPLSVRVLVELARTSPQAVALLRDVLTEATRGSEAAVFVQAMSGIGGHAGTDQLVAPLVRWLGDPSSMQPAGWVLVSFGARAAPAVPVLVAALEGPDRVSAARLLAALAPHLEGAVDACIGLVAAPDEGVARLGLSGVRYARLAAREETRVLAAALRHREAAVRRDAALTVALRPTRTPGVMPALVDRLGDDAATVRQAAELALAVLDSGAELQEAAARHPVPAVRKRAEELLTRLATRAQRSAFLARFDEEDDPVIRQVLIRAYGGSGRHLDFLARRLTDSDQVTAVRAREAVVALASDDRAIRVRLFASLIYLSGNAAPELLAASGAAGIADLLLSLENDSNDQLRLRVLAGARDAAWVVPILEELVPLARDDLRAEMRKTVEALRRSGAADEPEGARLVLVRWRLARAGRTPAVEDLRVALASGHAGVQGVAMQALVRAGADERCRPLYPAVLALVDASDPSLSHAAATTLVTLARHVGNPARIAPELMQRRVRGTPAERARAALIEAAVLNRPPAPGVVRRGLADPALGFRAMALQLLRQGSHEARLMALPSLLEQDDPSLRYHVAECIMNLGAAAAPALPLLRELLESGDPDKLGDIDRILVAIGAPAIPLLRQRLIDQLARVKGGRAYHSRCLDELAHGGEAMLPLLDIVVEAANLKHDYVPLRALHDIGAMRVRKSSRHFPAIERAFRAQIERMRTRGVGGSEQRIVYDALRRIGRDAAFAVPLILPHVERWARGSRFELARFLVDLEEMGATAAQLVPLLGKVLAEGGRDGPSAQQLVIGLIRKLGRSAAVLLPRVLAMLERKDAELAPQLLVALAPHCDAVQARQIALLAFSERPHLRHRSVYLRQALFAGSRPGYDVLFERLGEGDPRAAQMLAEATAAHPEWVWPRRARYDMRAILSGLAAARDPDPGILPEVLRYVVDPVDPQSELVAHEHALRALAAFGAAAVPHLRALLQRHRELARSIFAAAHRIGPAAAAMIPDQLAVLRDTDDAAQRRWLIDTMTSYGPAGVRALEAANLPDAGKALGKVLQSRDPALRQAAARALITVRYQDETVLGGLGFMLGQGADDRRWASYCLLSLLPDLPADGKGIARVTGFLASGDTRLRRQVMRAMADLPKWGDEGLRILTDGLLDPEQEVRLHALRALARWGGAARAARPAAAQLREDPDADVRAAVGEALAAIPAG